MTNPIETFQSLKSAYLRYLDSPFDLRFEEMVQARRRLLDRDGVLYREPLVEPQPPYLGSGHDIGGAVADVLASSSGWTPALVGELAQLGERGCFRLVVARRSSCMPIRLRCYGRARSVARMQ